LTRAVLPYALLVLLPTGVLAVLAFRSAGGDYREAVEGHRSRLAEEAAALAHRVEAAVNDAAWRADIALAKAWTSNGVSATEEPVGFAREGAWIGYRPEPGRGASAAVLDIAASEPAGEELRLFDLSVRGGESFEFALGDPARAVDAYGFYLHRIRAPALRARLRFRIARAALAAGRNDICLGIAGELEGEPVEAFEDGNPLKLLVSLLLRRTGEIDEKSWSGLFRSSLLDPSVPTPLLAHLAGLHFPDDAELKRLVEGRRALEAAVARRPEALRAPVTVLEDRRLLFARPVKDGGRGRSPLSGIVRVPVDLPPLEAGGFPGRLVPPEAGRTGPPEAARAPVLLAETGEELARIEVGDPDFPARLAALARKRDVQRALVGLLAVSTVAGGLALLLYLRRERALARLRARLVANVSHELKTPVTSIRMFSEMLAEDPLDEARTRRFGTLLRAESRRLSGLIENLLDFSRLTRKDVPLALEPVDLGALVDRVAEGFSLRAKEKGIEFAVAKGTLPAIRANAAAVERILVNLLDNAFKYRRSQGPAIRIAAEASGREARVAVADNGIGIPARDRERVFEEFYRVRYDDYGVQGTGLGLAIARRLARKMGGDVTLVSRVGAGSTFTLVLPLPAPADGGQEPAPPQEAP